MIKALAIVFATVVCGMGANMLIRQIKELVSNYKPPQIISDRDYKHSMVSFILMGCGILCIYGVMLWAIFTNL